MKKILLLILFIVTNIFAQKNASNINQKELFFLDGGYVGIGYGVKSGSASYYFNNQILISITYDIVYINFSTQLNLDSDYSRVSETMEFGNNKSWNEGVDA